MALLCRDLEVLVLYGEARSPGKLEVREAQPGASDLVVYGDLGANEDEPFVNRHPGRTAARRSRSERASLKLNVGAQHVWVDEPRLWLALPPAV